MQRRKFERLTNKRVMFSAAICGTITDSSTTNRVYAPQSVGLARMVKKWQHRVEAGSLYMLLVPVLEGL